jgi:hypothetical protein
LSVERLQPAEIASLVPMVSRAAAPVEPLRPEPLAAPDLEQEMAVVVARHGGLRIVLLRIVSEASF